MDILAALLLVVMMFVVVPVVACGITIAILGGGERFLPRAMRERATAQHEGGGEHH